MFKTFALSHRWSLLAAAAALAAAAPAQAQTEATGDISRHLGLGGGGIAIPGPNVSTMINPAALASPVGFRIRMPQVALSGQGVLNRDALDNIIEHEDLDHLDELGLGYVGERHHLFARAEQSIRYKTWEIGGTFLAGVAGTPNASARRWFRSGQAGSPPTGAQLLVETGYTVGIPIGYGHRFRTGGNWPGTLDVGLRIIPFKGRYQRRVFRSNRSQDIVDRQFDFVDRTDVGFDIGGRWAPERWKGTTIGLAARGINQPQVTRSFQQETVLDLGAAHQFNNRLLLVADALNLTSAGGFSPKFAVGAEYKVWKNLVVVRGAVTTRGLAGGIHLGPVGFAYTKDGEALLGSGLSF